MDRRHLRASHAGKEIPEELKKQFLAQQEEIVVSKARIVNLEGTLKKAKDVRFPEALMCRLAC